MTNTSTKNGTFALVGFMLILGILLIFYPFIEFPPTSSRNLEEISGKFDRYENAYGTGKEAVPDTLYLKDGASYAVSNIELPYFQKSLFLQNVKSGDTVMLQIEKFLGNKFIMGITANNITYLSVNDSFQAEAANQKSDFYLIPVGITVCVLAAVVLIYSHFRKKPYPSDEHHQL